MKKSFKLEWSFPGWILWATTVLIMVLPLLGIFWFLFQFNLPLFHAGDKWISILIISIWWLACSINIFGWSLILKGENSQ